MIVMRDDEFDVLCDELVELRAKVAATTITYVRPISVEEEDYRRLLEELNMLRRQVSDLQTAGSVLVQLKRDGDISYHVKNFHRKFDQPVREVPCIPGDTEVRFRAKLHAEEFLETMRAIFGDTWILDKIDSDLKHCTDCSTIRVNLPELADGLCDMDYIAEGTRACFGLPRVPILVEVQRANLDKINKPDEIGKPTKPPGWKPPDIEGVLRDAGWQG